MENNKEDLLLQVSELSKALIKMQTEMNNIYRGELNKLDEIIKYSNNQLYVREIDKVIQSLIMSEWINLRKIQSLESILEIVYKMKNDR